MAREGAHQRPGLALRAQRGVHRPQACPRRWPPSRPAPGRPPASRRSRGRPARRPRRRVERLGDEDDVDVADVVELAAAALAHGDDRQPARSARRRGSSARATARRGLERGAGEVGELAGDVRLGGGEVGRGEVDARRRRAARPVGDAQRVERCRPGAGRRPARRSPGRPRRRRAARAAGGGPADLGGPSARRRPAARQWPGWRGEVVAEGGRGAQHGEQPVAAAGRAAARRSAPPSRAGSPSARTASSSRTQRQQRPGRGRRTAPARRRRPVLEVGRLERVDEATASAGVGEQAGGPLGVGEAEPGEPADGPPRHLAPRVRTAHAAHGRPCRRPARGPRRRTAPGERPPRRRRSARARSSSRRRAARTSRPTSAASRPAAGDRVGVLARPVVEVVGA